MIRLTLMVKILSSATRQMLCGSVEYDGQNRKDEPPFVDKQVVSPLSCIANRLE